ncbi:hypothetical protein WISP_26322 [Willisornis vidua]|uniref:SAP protein n=1 Tax=Willisornis vidua TaxID=1566151 RepID=A0ABQ9DPK8_9PASS|nr:hypothetical protein WISP_26322 [Willisornis vidua]
MPEHSLGKELPDIHPKPPLAELKPLPCCSTVGCLREESNPHLATTSCQGVVESEEVCPEPPLLQAKHPQVPQPCKGEMHSFCSQGLMKAVEFPLLINLDEVLVQCTRVRSALSCALQLPQDAQHCQPCPDVPPEQCATELSKARTEVKGGKCCFHSKEVQRHL